MNIIGPTATYSFTAEVVLLVLSNGYPLSCLASYILVNMKEASEQGVNAGSSCRRTLSEIDFADGPAAQSQGSAEGEA